MIRRLPLFFFLLQLSLKVLSQNLSVVTYNEIPQEGISLVQGWRFNPNDSIQFANPNFDDSAWKQIATEKMLHELPELKPVRIGWLRLHLKIGSALKDKSLALDVWQNCASEIYLDGKLIRRYGVISSVPERVVPIGMGQLAQPVVLVPGKEHVLAVRFAIWENGFHLRNNGYFFWLTLTDFLSYQQLMKEVNLSNETFTVLLAVFFLISMLHLSFYRYDPTQRANLYFAVYAILSTVAFLIVNLQGHIEDARMYPLVYTPAFMIALMSGIWTARALCFLFEYSSRELMILMWALYILSCAMMIFYPLRIPFFIAYGVFQLINIWIAVRALRTRKRGAAIIATGFFASIFFVVISESHSLLGIEMSLLISQATVGLTYLAPALGISLYLAREFALDSNLLRQKLLQVEKLSAENLLHAHEKQQLLAEQNDKLEAQVIQRTQQLQASLDDLRSAQQQLIHSEKMASLGELTAGIAHEIKNPLNFVNNFSELGVELIDELSQELNDGSIEEARLIASDLKHNLDKINLHGKRADNIVKSMLEHSRAGSGEKSVVDINKLVEEYLRLAYHGHRAKNKEFQSKLITRLTAELPPLEVFAQDIGRVMLNLIGNAFDAVEQRARQSDDGYTPTVELSTEIQDDFIKISIKDNGIGIADAIKAKVMQPFFTTKPTGQGTGLGLSLSYDIIVKGHGGLLNLDSVQFEGTIVDVYLRVPNLD
jgi:two-component system NtrC family sensor kinase